MGYRSTSCVSRSTGIGLMTFETKAEADQQAQYSKAAYNTNLTPYVCQKCKQWHLAPTTSHTPSVTCDYCCGRDGEPKALYPTEEIALRRAAIIDSQRHVRLRPYMCPYFDGWHLTSN